MEILQVLLGYGPILFSGAVVGAILSYLAPEIIKRMKSNFDHKRIMDLYARYKDNPATFTKKHPELADFFKNKGWKACKCANCLWLGRKFGTLPKTATKDTALKRVAQSVSSKVGASLGKKDLKKTDVEVSSKDDEQRYNTSYEAGQEDKPDYSQASTPIKAKISVVDESHPNKEVEESAASNEPTSSAPAAATQESVVSNEPSSSQPQEPAQKSVVSDEPSSSQPQEPAQESVVSNEPSSSQPQEPAQESVDSDEPSSSQPQEPAQESVDSDEPSSSPPAASTAGSAASNEASPRRPGAPVKNTGQSDDPAASQNQNKDKDSEAKS